MKLIKRNINKLAEDQTNKIFDEKPTELFSTEVDTIVALTKSWKCCSCKSENYNNMWTCSWCKHNRCGNCKQLEG